MSPLPSDCPKTSPETERDCKKDSPKMSLFHADFSWVNEEGNMVSAADIDDVDLEAFQSQDAVLSKIGYQSCIDENDPAPHSLVRHRIKVLLDLACGFSNQVERKKATLSLAKYAVQPYDQIVKECNSRGSDSDKSIRQIEVQTLVRLQFWAKLGNTFLQMYKRKKLCRRQKKSAKGTGDKVSQLKAILLKDIIELLSKAAMRLPQSRPFQDFLQGFLDESFLSKGSLTMKEFSIIFDYFEVANPYVPAISDGAIQVPPKPLGPKKDKPSAVIPPPALLMESKKETKDTAKENQAKSAENRSGPTQKEKELDQAKKGKTDGKENLDFLKPVSLVAPASKKRNSLLSGSTGGQRSQFVGSHFNGGLSNMTSLFRQVKVIHQPVKKAGSQTKTKNRATATTQSSLNTNNPGQSKDRKVTIADPDPAVGLGQKRKQSQCFQTNASTKQKKLNRGIVQETPLPKKKSMSKISHMGIDSSLDKNSARQVVAAARSALRRQN